MKRRFRTPSGPFLPLVSTIVMAACSGSGEDGRPVPSDAAESISPESIRTADPYARGYTDADFPRVQELAPGVYSYEQLRSAGEEPITHVVIGSDHGDHTGGNTAFPEGVRYFAHPTSAAALQATADRQEPDEPAFPVATDIVEDTTVLELGGRTIEILFLGRAHTGGDLSVYLPEERILFMSEAYLHRVFPAMRSAFPSEWVAMIERAQAMDVETYVPGHGFVDTPEILEDELEVYRQALLQVIDEGERLHAEGLTLEEAQQQASFGDLETWSLRSSQGPVAIRQVYAELNGELPGGDR